MPLLPLPEAGSDALIHLGQDDFLLGIVVLKRILSPDNGEGLLNHLAVEFKLTVDGQTSCLASEIAIPELRKFAWRLLRTVRHLEESATLTTQDPNLRLTITDLGDRYGFQFRNQSPLIEHSTTLSPDTVDRFEYELLNWLSFYPTQTPIRLPVWARKPVPTDEYREELWFKSPADWFREFDACALLFHPFGGEDPDAYEEGPEIGLLEGVRHVAGWWHELAKVQLNNPLPFERRFWVKDLAERVQLPLDGDPNYAWKLFYTASEMLGVPRPAEQEIIEWQLRPLVRELRPFTGDQLCYFHFDMLYALDEPEPERGLNFTGQLDSVLWFHYMDECRRFSPTNWWPADRSWHVYTGYDNIFTLIGGATSLIDALCDSPDLEVMRVDKSKLR